MKTRVLVALLLLAICTAIYASEESTDAAERWRKTQELNQMAKRFKAETGFEGRVLHSTETMRLHVGAITHHRPDDPVECCIAQKL